MALSYDPRHVESKWQAYWEEHGTFRTPTLEESRDKPKSYILDMFPYPSGAGLHVGHPEGYTATDIVARLRRAQGYRVLHPMGWDAFGLPAEQHAIRSGTHPRDTTAANIANFRRQLKLLGFSYDWEREIDTTDPAYVRWTQWIFLRLFARGLAEQSEVAVNWCPALGTVLANEEVKDGRSEIGDHPVVRTPLRQWMLRITAYADELLAGLDQVDWPASTQRMQSEWIGRSEGAAVRFPIAAANGALPPEPSTAGPDAAGPDAAGPDAAGPDAGLPQSQAAARAAAVQGQEPAYLEVFTTRVDTLFGVTFAVLAPEHPLVDALTSDAQRQAVQAYQRAAAGKSDLDRRAANDKSGVFTGGFVTHPLTGKPVAVWIADYVLMGYGTGAVMAVPAHDERDFAFARRYGLEVVQVIAPEGKEGKEGKAPAALEAAYLGPGLTVNSGRFDGLGIEAAKQAITQALAERGLGNSRVQYKLRDWVFSRQRYWGEPIPIVFPVEAAAELADGSPRPDFDPRQGHAHTIRFDQPVALREDELPLRLPDLDDFRPGDNPAGPLARALDWRFIKREGRWYARETNTMPQWAGSCWYYLRFADPHNASAPFSAEAARAWLPVDLYIGGAEHAVLHLLYARFWHKVLHDEGLVETAEPFSKLVHQGMILGELEYSAYRTSAGDAEGTWVSKSLVDTRQSPPRHRDSGAELRLQRLAAEEVTKGPEGEWVLKCHPEVRIEARAFKMSKSRGNVINPDDIIAEFGADAMRLYEMFMGPLEATKPWSTQSIHGIRRFLERALDAVVRGADADAANADAASEKRRHRVIKKVSDDLEALRFNTAISALMVYVNELLKADSVSHASAETLALLLHPFAPHLGEEMWERLGHAPSIQQVPWPSYDEALCRDADVEIAVQVKGKVRARLRLPRGIDEAAALRRAQQEPDLAPHLGDRPLRKVIWVQDKLLNLIPG